MAGDLFDTMKTRVVVWAGAIGANGSSKDMLAAAIVAQKRVDYAMTFGSWAQEKNSPAYDQLWTANRALGKVIEAFQKGEKAYKDFEAVQNIYFAIQVLKDDDIMTRNPKAAAAAFDQLFKGFGKLAKHFGGEYNYVATLLEECGKMSFFSNMTETMIGEGSNFHKADTAQQWERN
jgi:hypothetical protein